MCAFTTLPITKIADDDFQVARIIRSVGGEVGMSSNVLTKRQPTNVRAWKILFVRGGDLQRNGVDENAACCRKATFIFENPERGLKPCELNKLSASYIWSVTCGMTTTAIVFQKLKGFLSFCRRCYKIPRVYIYIYTYSKTYINVSPKQYFIPFY